MDAETRRRLNVINRDFYATVAAEFDQTRGQPWRGWEPILAHLPAADPLRVLDVGCGNGRFGVYLAESLPNRQIDYHGVDNAAGLLARAEESLAALANVHMRVENRDVVEQFPDVGSYDLIGLFGVIHHVPGADYRREFMRALAARVAPGGLFALAAWRFYEYERFRERIAKMPDDLTSEQHDYLLDWRRGETALRYCHYVDDGEHRALVEASGLSEIATYRADGHTNDVNRYSLLRKHE